MTGRLAGGRSPSMMCRSVRQIAQHETFTRTSCAAGVGSGRSRSFSVELSIAPDCSSTIARIASPRASILPGELHRKLDRRRRERLAHRAAGLGFLGEFFEGFLVDAGDFAFGVEHDLGDLE